MKNTLLKSFFVALCYVGCAVSVHAQAATYPDEHWWDRGVEGNWEDSVNWDTKGPLWPEYIAAKATRKIHIEGEGSISTLSTAYDNNKAEVTVGFGATFNAGNTFKVKSIVNMGSLTVSAQMTTDFLENLGEIICTDNISANNISLGWEDSSFLLGGKELILRYSKGDGTSTAPKIDFWGGSINMGGGTVSLEGGSTSAMTVILIGDFSGTTGAYEVFSQVLMKNGTKENLDAYLASVDSVTAYVPKQGSSNRVYGELDASTNNLGDYWLHVDGNDQDGYDLKIDYVRDKAVPEPSAASLSLLAFASLLMRRRRA